eukprot:gb/GECH01003226.1/.p1 GENE.gb/GECH01003226.1/~~gb/GECH01003226.1/.p1  ORF type:complete len:168 (+),score=21.22 gb/GECH01003226.1/:1-504(+)
MLRFRATPGISRTSPSSVRNGITVFRSRRLRGENELTTKIFKPTTVEEPAKQLQRLHAESEKFHTQGGEQFFDPAGADVITAPADHHEMKHGKTEFVIALSLLVILAAFMLYKLYIVASAGGLEHPETDKSYTYMKIRNKPYPWECSDCNLLDISCQRACKAAKRAE